VPTFRGSHGLWKSHRAEELATPQAFRRDPRLVWEWYGWRREMLGGCSPNPAHRRLAAWILDDPEHRILYTQNVDGLHDLALEDEAGGPEAVPEAARPRALHGRIFTLRCTACGARTRDRRAVDASSHATLPRCPGCGALARPDVVWFGEALNPALLDAAMIDARRAGCALVVGTSALVHPAASLPRITAEAGGALVEVNPDATPLTPLATVWIGAAAGRIIPELLA
jgi:NAD-dependent deacetylase